VKALVTGGAGFIGSHLVEALLAGGHHVLAYDDLSSGSLGRLAACRGQARFRFVRGDVLDRGDLVAALGGCDTVFHLAANPDVRAGLRDTALDLRQEAQATHRVLEAMRRQDVRRIVLASSSTVYGAAATVVAEDYGPLLPVSLYGAGKLAAEGFTAAFCHLFGRQGWIFRFANVVGPRMTHGVIFDLAGKLERQPGELLVLGDGRQSKPYVHVTDCVDAMLFALERSADTVNLFNLGCDSTVDVATIAQVVIRAAGLDPAEVAVRYTGGREGWPGDVPTVRLNTTRLRALGWEARMTSYRAVERAAAELVAERRRAARP